MQFTKKQIAESIAFDFGWDSEGSITYFYKLSPGFDQLEVIVWSHPSTTFLDSPESKKFYKQYVVEIYSLDLSDLSPPFSNEVRTTLKFTYNRESEDQKSEAFVESHKKYLELCMKENPNTNKLKAV